MADIISLAKIRAWRKMRDKMKKDAIHLPQPYSMVTVDRPFYFMSNSGLQKIEMSKPCDPNKW